MGSLFLSESFLLNYGEAMTSSIAKECAEPSAPQEFTESHSAVQEPIRTAHFNTKRNCGRIKILILVPELARGGPTLGATALAKSLKTSNLEVVVGSLGTV